MKSNETKLDPATLSSLTTPNSCNSTPSSAGGGTSFFIEVNNSNSSGSPHSSLAYSPSASPNIICTNNNNNGNGSGAALGSGSGDGLFPLLLHQPSTPTYSKTSSSSSSSSSSSDSGCSSTLTSAGSNSSGGGASFVDTSPIFDDLSASFKRLYKSILNNKDTFEAG